MPTPVPPMPPNPAYQYRYADGHISSGVTGVSAKIAALAKLLVNSGHAAAWAGVNSKNNSLQTGVEQSSDTPGSKAYVELLNNGLQTFKDIKDLKPGETHKFSVVKQRGGWMPYMDKQALLSLVQIPRLGDYAQVTKESYEDPLKNNLLDFLVQNPQVRIGKKWKNF